MKVIAVDFDGTLCENKWPEIGQANVRIIYYLLQRQAKGDKLILWTCRTGDLLDAAVMWSLQHGLRFDAVNANLPERIAEYGNDCRKIFADEYWDDKSVIVQAGERQIIFLTSDSGYTRVTWRRAELAVAASSPWERLERWLKKWRCE
ncbi:MAG: hypothetical protein Q4E13_10460 [Clostridia bacterium]|nr:hypothetical protein [Clostridia bacterium]